MNKTQTRKLKQSARRIIRDGQNVLEGEFVKRCKAMKLRDRLAFAWIIVRGK
jgi:hypothetical protein